MKTPYKAKYDAGRKLTRVVIQMPQEEVEAIDLWGVPAGMPSRNAAVRKLVKDGLQNIKHKEHGAQ